VTAHHLRRLFIAALLFDFTGCRRVPCDTGITQKRAVALAVTREVTAGEIASKVLANMRAHSRGVHLIPDQINDPDERGSVTEM